MAITANTGSGNYNVNGTWVGNVQPGASDDVIIPASASVTILTGTTGLGRSMTVQASGTLIFAATSSTLTLGDGTAGAGNVAFSNAGTITIAVLCTINLISTSATQQTITCGGQNLPNITINCASNGSYICSDGLLMNGNVNGLVLTQGTIDLNGKSHSMPKFSTSGSGAKALTFNGATLSVSSTGTCWTTTSAGLTLTMTTGTIAFTASSSTVSASFGTGYSYYDVTFSTTSVGFTSGAGTSFHNITQTGAGGTFNPQDNNTTITNLLTLTGTAGTGRMLCKSLTLGTAVTITAASVSLTNVDFKDVTGAGAATWSGSSVGDCLGNTNITFTTPVTRYGVVAGNFSSTATWAATSGGAGGQSVPLPQDTVVLDGSSAAGTYTMNMARSCKDITCSSFVRTLSDSSATEIYGSISLSSGMTFSGTGAITLSGRSAGLTLTSNGVAWSKDCFENAIGGTYTLIDAWSSSSSSSTAIFLVAGTFTTANQSVRFSGANGGVTVSGSTAVLNLGSSTVSIQGAGASWTVTSGTVNAGTSNIAITTASASARTFAGGGKTYYDVTIGTGGAGVFTFTGSNSFNSTKTSGGSTLSVKFTAGTTTTYTGDSMCFFNGAPSNLITIDSTTASIFTVTKASGYVISDYLSVKSSTATGGAIWYAGSHSTNVSGNTGWIFTAPFIRTWPVLA